MTKPFAILKEIEKKFVMGDTEIHALKNVSLELHIGTLTAIMGPSGSGKSTLMNILGCLDPPTKGEYFLMDQNVAHLSDITLSTIRATQIGFVFQSFNLISQLSVYDNVALPFLYQPHPKEVKERVLYAIDKVGLSHRLTHRPNQLSGGEMQRTAIARAFAINPTFILADEPTGNLDTETGNSILTLFEDLNQQGVTILIITHDPSVSTHCQRTIKMRDGQIIHDQ
ncbi:uncharacterized ABC transporter ATP-binding protein YvrO [Parachlamydia acanthamoebae UV-7]|jgi:putative ABC transport system ATP-binding protein|uniref:Uncharacterized ABC transporter ATP-binding protein YvrO n=1 Tax=Parachlamydia acanthamoebae (strain UV7) TaxID=765952 RepID=F8L262_PARAV|nr:ABC transporter ATP-binding protein [Parachlamydia acanthamoebae]CCB87392.1 uncharacterized ABC transporter ATP-binding protein YvrO [Parachlamydia acanthamoebae UV-7]